MFFSPVRCLTLSVLLFSAGCTTWSEVLLEEPQGTRLVLLDTQEEFVFPVVAKWVQADDPLLINSDQEGGRPVKLILPNEEVLTGYLHVFKAKFDRVELMAQVKLSLSREEFKKAQDGSVITVFGYSAKNKPVYKIILGMKSR